MADRAIHHPLKRWQFYRQCFRHATTGAVGVISDVVTLLFAAPAAVKWFDPAAYAYWAVYLGGWGDALLWKVPLTLGGSILLGRLFTASYDLYDDKPSGAPASVPDTLRDKARRLAVELGQFVTMRRTRQPLRGIRAASVFADPSASDLTSGAYASETAQLYSDRFLERVNNIREQLTLIGIVDARLDQANANPALIENIQTISDRLREIATQLPDNPPSGVDALHEANTRHDNKLAALDLQLLSKDKEIAKLEGELANSHPRDIAQDKRIRIAERLRASLPPSESDKMKSQVLWVLSLANSPDTQYLARAIGDVLQPYFKVTVDHESSGRISHRYTQDDLRGLVLMLPALPKFAGAHNQYRDEYHQQYARVIIDAFGTEGIEIRQERASRFPKVSFIMLLVGRKA